MERHLKIGYFTPFFAPAWRFGGILRTSYELGKRLTKRGHQVNIYTTDVSNDPKQRLNKHRAKIDGMNVFYFKNFSNWFASKHKVFIPINIRSKLREEIEELDIVHLHDLYTILTYWLYRRVKNTKKPFLVSTEGILSPVSQNRFKVIKLAINSTLLLKVLNRANYIFAQNEGERRNLQTYGLSNVQILFNGIDSKQYKTLPPKNIFREKYNFSEDDIIVLYLGRLNEIKGLNYLIRAFSMIEKNKKLKLVLVGPDDNYLNYLISLILKYNLKNRVKIINGLYGQEKLEAYSGADIFCLPSIYDCCPNSMIEALAAGLPVVTTSNNNLCNIIEDSCGEVIEPKNPVEIKESILRIVKNLDTIRISTNKHKNEVLNSFDWDNIVNSLENYYYKSLT
ncbi:MAG: glycosyltransferase [Candidatus Lokiarchaeota archaeon]